MSAPLQTADRALQVLQLFRNVGEGLTVTAIANRLRIHRSTASRLAATLERRGFLERDAPGELLRLGPEVARIGRTALAGRALGAVARPVMERLATDAGETVTLAVPASSEVLTIAQVEGDHFVSSGNWVGIQTPLHCVADGKVLLAFDGAEPGSGELVAPTERTIRDREALAHELEVVRRRGFAIARGELEAGLVGLAVPVWDGGSCIAALCVSGPEYRLDGDAARQLAPRCITAATELERALGARHTGPVEPR